MPKRELLTIAEAAKYINMSRSWLYDHSTRKQPHVPVIRMGGRLMYDPLDLDQFVNERAEFSRRKALVA